MCSLRIVTVIYQRFFKSVNAVIEVQRYEHTSGCSGLGEWCSVGGGGV